MSNSLLDALLPGSAALGLLVTLAVGPARAVDETAVVAGPAAMQSSKSSEGRRCRRVDDLGMTTSWPCR